MWKVHFCQRRKREKQKIEIQKKYNKIIFWIECLILKMELKLKQQKLNWLPHCKSKHLKVNT